MDIRIPSITRLNQYFRNPKLSTMKKYLAILTLVPLLWACEEDGNGGNNGPSGYPTDNLDPEEEKPALLFFNYDPSSGASAGLEITRLILEDNFQNELNHLSFVLDPNSPLYSDKSDSLAQLLGPSFAPSFFLNGTSVMPGLNLIVDIEDAVMRRPVASVEHAVTRTDTAWLVDAKVKFWRDTLGAGFRIATYFLANVDAANYSTLGLDLRMGEVQNFIAQGDSLSTWITDVPNLDSTRNVTSNGEVYVHPFVLVDNFWPLSFLGRELGSFTPFGFQFNENDIIGTRSTPIRSYFLYPEEMEDPDEMAYAFEPAFLTVIWFQNPATGNVSYINSFLSTSR